MTDLIVVGFKKDVHRASEVLDRLRAMDRMLEIDLHDAVAIYRDYRGKLRVDQSYQATIGQGAARGAFIGAFIGAVLVAPLTAGASIAAVAAGGALGGAAFGTTTGAITAAAWKQDYGITDGFVEDVSGMVQPGDSAIVALLETVDRDHAVAQFKGYGGMVLQTTLSAEQKAKIEATLQAG
jgi:uncharacterized membrane protein